MPPVNAADVVMGPRRGGGARERDLTEYVLRRLGYFVAVLFLVTMVTFSVALLLPGDPALAYIGEANMRDKAMYETMRTELGPRSADSRPVCQVAGPRAPRRPRPVDPDARAGARGARWPASR